MAEELGKIEKPEAENFRLGRKLLFVPLLYAGEGFPDDYVKITATYWEQVLKQVTDITSRLGSVKHVFHELISDAGDTGAEGIKQLNPGGQAVIDAALAQGAKVAAFEDANNLTEFMDWSRSRTRTSRRRCSMPTPPPRSSGRSTSPRSLIRRSVRTRWPCS